MKYFYGLKRKFVEWTQYRREKESKLFSLIIVATMIFILMSVVNDKSTRQLKDERIILQDELLKTQTKLQTTYFIIVRQGETIDNYKAALMKCKGDTLWTQKNEIK